MYKKYRFLSIVIFMIIGSIRLWGDTVIYPAHTISKYNEAVKLYDSGNLQEACDLFIIIIRESTQQPELIETRVQSAQYLGWIYRDLKYYERSNKWFRAAVVMINSGDYENQEEWQYTLANEIKINHELISLVDEQQRMKDERRQNRTAMLAILTVLLLIVLSAFSYMIYQLRRTNRALAKKNLELTERFSVFENSGSLRSGSMKEILDYIESEKAYLKADFCLDDLCFALGKNRSYISREFSHEQTNFKSVVNKYRIKEAIMLLVSHPEMNIDEVWESSGFNSRTTFYNTFSEATGLSPSAFRKANQQMTTVSEDGE